MDIHPASAVASYLAAAGYSGLILAIAVDLGLTLFYALVAAIEYSYPLMSQEKLRKSEELSASKREILLQLAANPLEFRAFMRSLRLLSTLFMGLVVTLIGWTIWAQVFALKPSLSLALTVFCLLLQGFCLQSFAAALPARLAARQPEQFALRSLGALRFLQFLFKPFSTASAAISSALLRKAGIDPTQEAISFSEEELRNLLDKSKEDGSIPNEEQLMIENVFEFGDKTAENCMTHRMDLVAVDIETEMDDLLRLLSAEKFTRMPVYKEDIDHICGIFNSRDLLLLVAEGRQDEFALAQVMRAPFYAPESAKISALLRDLQRTRNHMAVIIDEYGGTAGVVTMEDLLEEIVGQIQDEYDEEEPAVVALGEQSWLIEGGLAMEDLEDILKRKLPLEDYDTVAGFFLDILDRIPTPDEQAEIVWENVKMAVAQMDDKRIAKIVVSLLPTEAGLGTATSSSVLGSASSAALNEDSSATLAAATVSPAEKAKAKHDN